MNTMPAISDCKLYELPKITDPRGNLTFIESDKHIPFAIQRVFYLYDVPTEESRGAHAHHTLNQLIICLSGSFDVEVDDGKSRTRIHLNRPWKGLHVPPLIWAAEVNFDPGSVALILASDMYKEEDYIRDYDDYLALIKNLASKQV
ncbi:sugar 3,4-ketoisomerase [Paraburkholderia sediminicola]|uniref:sugar 3,4-ketoisomerase n=1 Tax=Paraburkholderia sediminicola TaxID=458836 RepID=UPI0038BCAFC7